MVQRPLESKGSLTPCQTDTQALPVLSTTCLTEGSIPNLQTIEQIIGLKRSHRRKSHLDILAYH